MKLARIVTIKFDGLTKVGGMHFQVGDVTVTMSCSTFNHEESNQLLVIAEVPMPTVPTVGEDEFVVVPERERRACEEAIELLANLVSVAQRSRRTISSAFPCIAFLEVSEQERAKLNRSKGFRNALNTLPDLFAAIDITDANVLTALINRPAGIALLAEALANTHPVGKYRELVRFFEHAFARSLHDLEKKLTQFLCSSDYGYSREEIQGWVAHRHAAVHGDRKAHEEMVMEANVRRLVHRMEQAAYDVLFNKRDWNAPSSARLDTVRLDAGSTSSDLHSVQARKDSTPTLQAQLFDMFDAYPLNLNGVIMSPPREWWWEPEANSPDEAY